MGHSSELTFFLNGSKVVLQNVQPETTLLQYVRSVGLTGTKLGCGEGGCGACTVMVSHYDKVTQQVKHRAVNSCLFPLCAADGLAIITVEALGNTKDGLDPVQKRIADSNGSQCGFCTPGIVMALYAYLRSNPNATAREIEASFDGNLCRCTGYRPIIEAAKTFAKKESVPSYGEARSVIEFNTPVPSGASICPSTGLPCDCGNNNNNSNQEKVAPNLLDSANLTSDIIFPQFLKKYEPASLKIAGEKITWYRPTSLAELLEIKKEHNNAKIVMGNSEIGIEMKFKNQKYPIIIHPTAVPELHNFSVSEEGVTIGSAITLSELSKLLQKTIDSQDEYKTRTLVALKNQLHWFAGAQIRNVASIAGNICTASPISDINPILIAAKAQLKVVSKEGERVFSIREFFIRYRVVNLEPDEILHSVFIPFNQQYEFVHEYKQARRREDDIAIVTSGIRVVLSDLQGDGSDVPYCEVKEISFGYGGMAPKTVFCPITEEALVGKRWNEDIVALANECLARDLPLADNAPGGMIQYRKSLTTSFFFKFYLFVTSQIEKLINERFPKLQVSLISDRELSAIAVRERPESSGRQTFEEPDVDLKPVSQPIKHLAADKQVTGEAVYTVDIPDPHGCLFAAYVLSTRAHAKIVSIDPSKALEIKGVVAFFSSKDVPSNKYSIMFDDEEVFASEYVTSMGKPVGLIVAESHDLATEASKLVQVTYEDLEPIITIEQAIAKESFYPLKLDIKYGDIDEGFQSAKHIVEGTLKTGAQDHFYLETHNTLAVPLEDEITIYSSTQNPTKNQLVTAKVLNIPAHRIKCICKRMGGGFGGKETKPCVYSAVAALAATKLKRAVRLTLDRDVDMTISGLRHPFLSKYKIGFNDDGNIVAMETHLYSNAGDTYDLSLPVLERAVLHGIDNCYKINAMHSYGTLCKTNITSNTAFRGFGGPQGMMVMEHCIEHISKHLKLPSNIIRERNFYQQHDRTYYGQVIEECPIREIWDKLVKSSEYDARKKEVFKFNDNNRWRKRGIAVIPTKFAIAFTFTTYNQAGALVHVYMDGSVLVTHGGTEMGQGLHTKIAQIAATALNIPLSKITINDTDTSKVPNTSPTAASVSTDINGMAVHKACMQILERLRPYLEKYPEKTWEEIIADAYHDRVNLSANGFHAIPNLSGYQFFGDNKGGERVCDYYTWGAACSEVEIDVLTGDYELLRTDILMDIGRSINPSIDIGQIEGGFIQGLGWCTLEEIVWFDNGYQFTRGPGAYKIPSFNDVPIDFRVAVLKKARNNMPTIYSSKGVGEPPFFLAASAFFAIKNACYAARMDAGIGDDHFILECPATAERIRLACSQK